MKIVDGGDLAGSPFWDCVCTHGNKFRDGCGECKSEWLEEQFAAGRKDLMEGDPYWREHFMVKAITEAFEAGERVPLGVPLGVLLVSNEPPTDEDIRLARGVIERMRSKPEES